MKFDPETALYAALRSRIEAATLRLVTAMLGLGHVSGSFLEAAALAADTGAKALLQTAGYPDSPGGHPT